VGTGFAGLGAAIRLKDEGISDFILFERARDVGGTWRDNSYPGCACDVESHLYSFSFAPNPDWSRLFSPQGEIFAYLRRCARDYGILPHVRFDHELLGASWDDHEKLWKIDTSQGEYTAGILIGGMGALCEPSIPNLPGLERFEGKAFHSARWDHEHDLRGRQVAVVGTGASAIQFIPEIQPKVGKLTVFQRTPAWVIPRLDREVTAIEKRLFRSVPAVQKLVRAGIYARRELFVLGFRKPAIMRVLEKYARGYLARSVPDPVLRAKLTPDFTIGCKRILISKEYLPSLTKPNVEVVTEGIKEVRERSVVTADGVEHPADTIIFGTGFHVTDMPFAHLIRGRDGRTLPEAWGGSPKAHLGTTVAGYPNLFLLLGPNTGLGHTSVVLMIESQIELLIGAIRHMRAHGHATVEPRPEAQARFVQDVQESMEGTVWTSGGCASWYIDPTGRNSTLWPGFTFSFMRRARFRAEDYALDGRAAEAPHGG
jgi:cation diffusion facilitator CzcD-associated flavoprotein CzcO